MHEDAWVNSEAYTLFFLKISALSFPVGMIVVTAGEYVVKGLAFIGLDLSLIYNQKVAVVAIWLTMTLTGFFQWFVFVPKLYNWFVRKRRGKGTLIR
ncbi:MAG: hypothetical protein PVF13_04230 [Chromatiales bacterium]|jgi:hypothetical protein